MSKKARKHKKPRRKRVAEKKELFKGVREKISKAGLWIMFTASAVIVAATIVGLMWFFLTEANFHEILKI